MASYSRKRPANKGEITSPVVRIQQDQTTGRITHVVRDDVQRAADALVRSFESVVRGWAPDETARQAERAMYYMATYLSDWHGYRQFLEELSEFIAATSHYPVCHPDDRILRAPSFNEAVWHWFAKLNTQQKARAAGLVIRQLVYFRPNKDSHHEIMDKLLDAINSNHGKVTNAHTDSQGRGENLPALP